MPQRTRPFRFEYPICKVENNNVTKHVCDVLVEGVGVEKSYPETARLLKMVCSTDYKAVIKSITWDGRDVKDFIAAIDSFELNKIETAAEQHVIGLFETDLIEVIN
jgi:hypothetical protein